MYQESMKEFADAIWDYILEKHLKPYLADSVCYYVATVSTAPSGGVIGVQRAFDNAVTLPCAKSAEGLAIGDPCTVLVFGDFSNQLVIGDPKGAYTNSYYATCSTGASTQAKVASTPDGNFKLQAGNVVTVVFASSQSYNGIATLNVDGTGAKDIYRTTTDDTSRYYWATGAAISFLYDGTKYLMINKGYATTTYYGVTKLSNSLTSTSTSLAASANAVKLTNDKITALEARVTALES